MPGVIEFVRDLVRRRIKPGIATSASKSRTLSTLQRLRLTDSFATVVTGEDVPEGKSSLAIYELGCARLRTEARYSLVVEDAAPAVRAAKSAGFRCIGVASGCGAKLQAGGADHVIEDFVGFSLDDLANPSTSSPPARA